MTFGYLSLPPLLKLRQIDWFAARPTDATVQGVFDDERSQGLVFVALKDIDEEWVGLRVLTASATAAKATRSQGSAFTRPAVQPSRSPRPHVPRAAEPSPAPT